MTSPADYKPRSIASYTLMSEFVADRRALFDVAARETTLNPLIHLEADWWLSEGLTVESWMLLVRVEAFYEAPPRETKKDGSESTITLEPSHDVVPLWLGRTRTKTPWAWTLEEQVRFEKWAARTETLTPLSTLAQKHATANTPDERTRLMHAINDVMRLVSSVPGEATTTSTPAEQARAAGHEGLAQRLEHEQQVS